MWLTLLVLFAALSPGILFTAPPLGKKIGGKLMTAVVHAVLFVIVVKLLYVVHEGFQMGGSSVTSVEQAQAALDAAQKSLSDSMAALDNANKVLAQDTYMLRTADAGYNSVLSMIPGDKSAILADQQKLAMDQKKLDADYMNMAVASDAGSKTRAKITADNSAIASLQVGVEKIKAQLATAQNGLVMAQKAAVDAAAQAAAQKAAADATAAAAQKGSSSILAAIGNMVGMGAPHSITMVGGNSPVQPMPPGLCPTTTQYPLLYNGRNDGTGPNGYTTLCTPCANKYRGNSKIPSNIDKQNMLNFQMFCGGL